MKFLDLFAGIGGFHLGMEQAGHKCVGYVEWDKFARQSYQAIYNTKGLYNGKDIKSVTGSELPKADVWCFGSPCTNLSMAGNQKGLKGEQSSMFFEVIRLLKETSREKKPTYLFMENVKNLLSSQKGWDFAELLSQMDEVGYDVEWSVVNSKDFGVPQNRERVFIIGHLRGKSTRKVFPIFGEDKEINPANAINPLKGKSDYGWHFEQEVHDENGLCRTVKVNGGSGNIPKVILNNPARLKQIGNLSESKSFGGNPQVGRVYSTDGLSPTLNTMQGGGREPKVLVKNNTKKGYDTATVGDSINFQRPNDIKRRARVGHGIAHTLDTQDKQATLTSDMRIRKLTPLECWRLQGFPDWAFYKAKNAGMSNSQLYKQAGNSVTVPAIEAIAEKFK